MKKVLSFVACAALLCGMTACTPSPAGGESSVSGDDTASGGTSSAIEKLEWTDADGDGVIRVACVGDSITAGNENSNYPAFLAEYLEYLGTVDGNKYEVKNFGKGGAAVRNVPEADGTYFWYGSEEYLSSLEYNADIVIVQMGTNDGTGGNLDAADSYFKTDYTDMIKPYMDSGATVILATPPCAYNSTHPAGVNGKISDLVRELAGELDLQLIDMNVLTAGHSESFPDGLHGNDSGYSLIAQIYYQRIFGGRLLTATIKTQPGATVELDIHMAVADRNGTAKITLVDYTASRSYPIKIVCTDYKIISDSITINADTTYTYEMTPGDYNVTGSATATAESVTGTNTADLAVDGDDSTRWESAYKDNTWLLVDLGEVKKITGVYILWEGAYASEYNIEVSADGSSYTKVAEVTNQREGLVGTSFDETDARYIRVNCVKRGTKFGSSIKEIQVLSDNR